MPYTLPSLQGLKRCTVPASVLLLACGFVKHSVCNRCGITWDYTYCKRRYMVIRMTNDKVSWVSSINAIYAQHYLSILIRPNPQGPLNLRQLFPYRSYAPISLSGALTGGNDSKYWSCSWRSFECLQRRWSWHLSPMCSMKEYIPYNNL